MALPDVPLRNWVLIDPVGGEWDKKLLTREYVQYLQTTADQINTNKTVSDANAVQIAANEVKLNGFINVVSRGATGDGVTDDTAAIEAAIAACPAGGVVYFPPCAEDAFYRLTSAITVTRAIRLCGAGYEVGESGVQGSVLTQDTVGENVLTCSGVDGLVIEHLALGCVARSGSALAIGDDVTRSRFTNVFLAGGGTGLSVGTGNTLNTYEGVRVSVGVSDSSFGVPSIGFDLSEGGSSKNLWVDCEVSGCVTGISLNGSGTWVNLSVTDCEVGILWASGAGNTGNVFLNPSTADCTTVHSVTGTPTQQRALAVGDATGNNAFALPTTVGTNLRTTMSQTLVSGDLVDQSPLLTSPDPVLLGPDTVDANNQQTVRATLDVRGANTELESDKNEYVTEYVTPKALMVVENTQDTTNVAIQRLVASGTDNCNAYLTTYGAQGGFIGQQSRWSEKEPRTDAPYWGNNNEGTPAHLMLNREGGNVSVGGESLATGAERGFFFIPSMGGTPTGTLGGSLAEGPATIGTSVPLVYDRTNNKLYIFNGSWKSVTFA